MKIIRSLITTKIIAIPTILCCAICWKGHYNFTNIAGNNNNDKKLVYVHIFVRHGDKTPSHLIHSKEYENKLWLPLLSKQYYCSTEMKNATKDNKLNHWKNINKRLNGTYLKSINSSSPATHKNDVTMDASYKCVWFGQLTEKGVLELQDIGKWLRSRYVNEFCYLSPTYKSSYNQSSKLHIESTNYNRTIFSVDSLLYGLYNNNQRFKGDQIPIHIDKDRNHLLVTNTKCKKFYKEMFSFMYFVSNPDNMKPDIMDIHNKLKDSYKFAGAILAQSLNIRLHQNIDLPTGIDKCDIQKYVDYMFSSAYDACFKRHDMLKLSIGVLLGKLLNSMQTENATFIVSSGHDFTVAPMLWCILRHCKDKDVIKKHNGWPNYGDNIIFEVWKFNINDDNQRFVRILHNKEVLLINGKEFIPLIELEYMWKDLIISEQTLYNIECCC